MGIYIYVHTYAYLYTIVSAVVCLPVKVEYLTRI
jgi:hypothetical protein